MSAWTCRRARSPQRLFHLVLGSHDGRAWCPEGKRVLASDLDTVMVDSLKALDLIRPIREADMSCTCDMRSRFSIFALDQIPSSPAQTIICALNAVEQRRKLAVALTMLRDVVGRFATACGVER
jgi:hypothetical protein